MGKVKYYSLNKILSHNATYNVIFGERSNGKTYAVLDFALKDFFDTGRELAIIRRFDEDFTGANSSKTCFDHLMYNGNGENMVEKYSKGEYTGIEYYGGKYYLTQRDDDQGKFIRTKTVIAHGFSLSSQEHYKSASFPKIGNILFDEFMTRKFYLNDEFILFQNLLSTIIRSRDDVKIFMLANTVNKYACPYFTEMGLKHVKDMKQGAIDVYTYSNTKLTVAVEYTDNLNKQGKPSDKYFAFDNPRLQMIQSGSWEIGVYPHLPVKYSPKDIMLIYFIIYEEQILQCEIISLDNSFFTFIHRKTTEIKNDDYDIIYTPDYSPKPNYSRKISTCRTQLQKRIYSFYTSDKVFYQDNEVGEIVRNYLEFCYRGD